LDVLGNAAASFSTRIKQQLEMLQSGLSAEIAKKTTNYAKATYFKALQGDSLKLVWKVVSHYRDRSQNQVA
jgi:hypothetical protein